MWKVTPTQSHDISTLRGIPFSLSDKTSYTCKQQRKWKGSLLQNEPLGIRGLRRCASSSWTDPLVIRRVIPIDYIGFKRSHPKHETKEKFLGKSTYIIWYMKIPINLWRTSKLVLITRAVVLIIDFFSISYREIELSKNFFQLKKSNCGWWLDLILHPILSQTPLM